MKKDERERVRQAGGRIEGSAREVEPRSPTAGRRGQQGGRVRRREERERKRGGRREGREGWVQRQR
jgi:hypothetical protein